MPAEVEHALGLADALPSWKVAKGLTRLKDSEGWHFSRSRAPQKVGVRGLAPPLFPYFRLRRLVSMFFTSFSDLHQGHALCDLLTWNPDAGFDVYLRLRTLKLPTAVLLRLPPPPAMVRRVTPIPAIPSPL